MTPPPRGAYSGAVIPSRLQWILVVAALSLFVGLGVSSLNLDSATFDEGKHLPVGYAFLKLGDYRFDPDNPPLGRMLAATPLLFMDVRVDREDRTYRQALVWGFGHRFLYEWNDADRLVMWGRVSMVVLGALLACLVFLWARTLAGVPAAAAALFLYILNPDVLAHSRLATTDLPVTIFFFATVAAFERLTARVTWPRLLLTALCLGSALASKYSAVALFPVLGVLGLVVALGAAPLEVTLGLRPGPSRSIATGGGRLATLLALLLGIGCVAWVVVWAVYRFRFMPAAPAGPTSLAWDALPQRGQFLDRLVLAGLNAHLLPGAYLYGFLDMLQRGQDHPAFLMGRISQDGWWYYFPVSFALKTPIPLMLLLLGGAVSTLKSRARSLRVESFLWLPPAIYGAMAVVHGLNIGHRHLLPMAPFLFVIGGRAAAGLWESRRRASKAVVLLLAGWYALSTARIHPHYLAYFNEIAGGPANGSKYLVDSNLDWGQDLKRLKSYVDEKGVGRILLSYMGSADPEYYAIPCDLLPGRMLPTPRRLAAVVRPGDVVAVSVTNLRGVYLSPSIRPLMERLRALTPMAVIGYSIYVYRSNFTWILPAEAAHALEWTSLAVESYRRAIQIDPDFVDAYGNLGMAMHLLGRHREAVASFQQALARDEHYLDGRPDRLEAYRVSVAAAPGSVRGPGP